MSHVVSLIALAFALQVPAPNAPQARSAELLGRRRAIESRERERLTVLSERLKSRGGAAGAAAVSALAAPQVTTRGASRYVPLPDVTPASKKGPGMANVGPDEGWERELQSVRDPAAKEFFKLALEAVAKPPRHYALADECLHAVLARQPDHPEARRLLGFVTHQGGWATPYAVGLLKKGNVLHPTYGWVPGSWVPHLEKGELPAPSGRDQHQPRWLPAAEADQLHSPWEKAWRIPTEHFLIRTNVPLSEAIAFSRQLEDFHQLFFSLTADIFGDRLPLAQRFQKKDMVGERESKPHEVYYFATQQEFVDFLTPLEGPGISRSLGLFIPPRGKAKRQPAYFFRDDKGQLPVTATLYHEVSHQLLFESGLGDPEAYKRNQGNYWVFEGLGTYFETLVRAPDGALEVGGLVGKRIEYARQHLVENQEYIPLEEFTSYDQERFNADKGVFLHYQEAIALAVFFMQAGDAKYREGFLDYVSDAYKGQVRRLSRSLEARLGVPYGQLDSEFLAYLKGG